MVLSHIIVNTWDDISPAKSTKIWFLSTLKTILLSTMFT